MRVLALAPLLALIALPALAEAPAATISVNGQGQVQAAPDMATISLGVTANADTAKAALDANSTALEAVIARLGAAGIEPRDIQTSNLSLGPVFDSSSPGGAQKILGYSASNMVSVRVRDVATVGSVLDASVSDGANVLNGITFGLTDSQAAEDEARRLAVADARRKAEDLAAAAGVKLGPVVQISDMGGFMPPMPMGGMAMDAKAAPVQAGELAVATSVSVTFAIAP